MSRSTPTLVGFKEISEQDRNKFKKDQLIQLILHVESPDIADLSVAIKGLTELLADFQKQQQEDSRTIVAMKVDIEVLRDENRKLRHEMSACLNNLEQRARINNVEIVGLRAPTLMETDTNVALNFLNETLEAGVVPEEIEALHPVPSKRQDKKRIFVIHFKFRARRDGILSLAKEKLKNYKKDLPAAERVYVNEHLSPGNKRLFALATKKKHELNYKFVWSRGGVVFMRKNEGSLSIKITSDEDFDDVV